MAKTAVAVRKHQEWESAFVDRRVTTRDVLKRLFNFVKLPAEPFDDQFAGSNAIWCSARNC